jgi:hypothetical protein
MLSNRLKLPLPRRDLLSLGGRSGIREEVHLLPPKLSRRRKRSRLPLPLPRRELSRKRKRSRLPLPLPRRELRRSRLPLKLRGAIMRQMWPGDRRRSRLKCREGQSKKK